MAFVVLGSILDVNCSQQSALGNIWLTAIEPLSLAGLLYNDRGGLNRLELKHSNYRPSRPPIGQHWLIDSQALKAMVEMVDLGQADFVCEIGTGGGQLTDQILASKPRKLISIELDVNLFRGLETKYRKEIESDRLSLKNQDCLTFDYSCLPVGYKICANIPYYLAAKLLKVLTDCDNQPQMASLMLPKAVASRLGDTKKRSLLATVVQNHFEVEIGPTVGAQSFLPPPKIDSQMIRLRNRGDAKTESAIEDWDNFNRFLGEAFSRPRQYLKNNLKKMAIQPTLIGQIFTRFALDDRIRPENVDDISWDLIYRFCRAKIKDESRNN